MFLFLVTQVQSENCVSIFTNIFHLTHNAVSIFSNRVANQFEVMVTYYLSRVHRVRGYDLCFSMIKFRMAKIERQLHQRLPNVWAGTYDFEVGFAKEYAVGGKVAVQLRCSICNGIPRDPIELISGVIT